MILTRENYWSQHTVVVLLAVATGLSFGLCYGLANHNTYLLHPLRALDPEFLKYDWLAAKTTAYHQNFALLIRLLAFLDALPWAVSVANVALVASFILAMYGFLTVYCRREAFVAILLIISFVLLEKTGSVGSSHILTSILEPSSVAASAVVVALLLLLAERYFWSGIFLAIGGFFHSNFLLLDFVFFGLAHVMLGRKGLIERLVFQFVPSLAIFLYQIPVFYAIATDALGAEARYIFHFVRSPHHYVPTTYLRDFVPFAGWHLLAISCLGLPHGDPKCRAILARVYAVFFGLVIAATLLTTLVYVPFVSQLFFWRMAPFSLLLAQLVFVAGIAACGQGESERPRVDVWRWILAIVGGGLILTHHTLGANPTAVGLFQVDKVFATLEFVAVLAVMMRARALATVPSFTLPLGLVLAGLGLSAVPAYDASNVLHGLSSSKRELYYWASSTTPESQFLIPPGLKTFRLHSRRAVVVDWKSTPVLPGELLEWYRRMCQVSGNPKVKNLAEAEAGYARIDQARIATLVAEYGIDYAVFEKPFDPERLRAEVVFSNKKYLVLKPRRVLTGPSHT